MTQRVKNIKPEPVLVARIFVKRTCAIVYQYRASEGTEVYCTTVIAGKATGCSCTGNSVFHHTCKHMKNALKLEEVRQQVASEIAEVVTTGKPSRIAHINDYRQFKAEDAYEVLATTKNASDEWQRYRYYEMGIGA